jgi:sugar phosphate permease
VPARESGLASGLLNTSQQIGGSLGLAILSGVAASATTRYFTHHAKALPPVALVHGFHDAYFIAACFAVGSALVAAFVIKQRGPAAAPDPSAMVS